MLWQPDYDTPLSWQSVQQPAPGRITVASRDGLPGRASRWKPTGGAMRARLEPGEGRAEVYARAASPMSGTPPEAWSDPVGSERWYGWSLLVPTGHVFAPPPLWLVSTQWKGYRGGSSPVAVEIHRDNLRLGGARANAGIIPGNGILGPIAPGAWTRLAVGLRHSPDPAVGWVEVWRDGAQVLARTPVATMDLIDGKPDPTYFKQGVYRDPGWTVPHELFFGPATIGTSRDDVS